MNVAIIQARMGSRRLPGKVLRKINGQPVLWYVINRTKLSKNVDRIIVATSIQELDNDIAALAVSEEVDCYRGSEKDVLDRFYQAAKNIGMGNGDSIVRITADCPLIDPEIMDQTIDVHIKENSDYTTNTIPPSYPDGLDVEVISFRALEECWKNAVLKSDREHVTPYIVNNRDKYIKTYLKSPVNYNRYRLTLDEIEDLKVIESVLLHFGHLNFNLDDLIEYLKANPRVAEYNLKYKRNYGYLESLRQLMHERVSELLRDKTILITGGTGSFGNRFIENVLEKYEPKKIIVYSRDEYKQYHMKQRLAKTCDMDKLRFFIGDVRDKARLYMACNGVDYIIHAAALKQVPVCEYNPFEAVKTNILGAQNVIEVALERNVKKVIALSTDKAVNPINLYGGTKLVSDKLFVSSNAYSGGGQTCFSVVRYGNVAGSRGSVIPFFTDMVREGCDELPITDFRMTRFWITLNQGVELVFRALIDSKGGETYISKISSFKVVDLAKAIGGDAVKLREVGIREGEKLHEVMITREDSKTTYEYDEYFVIYPNFEWWDYKNHFTEGGVPIDDGFEYCSDTNSSWLDAADLRELINEDQF